MSPGGYDWIGLDFHLNLGARFELHLVTMLVDERIGYADFTVEGVRTFHGDLSFFRFARYLSASPLYLSG